MLSSFIYPKLNLLLLILSIFVFLETNAVASSNPTKGISSKDRNSEVGENLKFNPLKWFSDKYNISLINENIKFNPLEWGTKKKPTLSTPVLLSKYSVNFSITAECKVNEYYKNAQTIFFPLLRLNSDGSLLNNYVQSYSNDKNYLIFSSKDNINNSIQHAANKFSSKFDFTKTPSLFTVPIELEESYLIRFYYYLNSEPFDYNSVYLKSSIEYINPNSGLQQPNSVWTGEAYFAFDKSIAKASFLDVAIRKIFEYAFMDYKDNGTFHILDM